MTATTGMVVEIRVWGESIFKRMMIEALLTPQELGKAMREVCLWAEDTIKEQHYPGHGKITGNLQRSYHTNIHNNFMGSVETTPASLGALSGASGSGSRVFYAPFVNALYHMIEITATMVPKVAEAIYDKYLYRVSTKITGGI